MKKNADNLSREGLNLVITGHVDHGKSTVIGRLLADTGSLPEGKLKEVQERCLKNARPFEYAFLLDALKDEQAQGITIDSARVFFKTQKRHYIIFDAPGHIEFLKNMVTGAAQAEAALLVIDAHEGIQENSKRHGYLLSMLGIKQLAIVVNKMDIAAYRKDVFDNICSEYSVFLGNLNIKPAAFIPVCAIGGENIAVRSKNMDWYKGPTVLEQIDSFIPKESPEHDPFRFPVQDIYKFTEENDERRILAGTIMSGTISAGDRVVFLPSGKESNIAAIEEFNAPEQKKAGAGRAVGFTLQTQIYTRPGEIMAKAGEKRPKASNRFRANIFWMGKNPLIKGKNYKIKVSSARINAQVEEIINVIDALELSALGKKNQVNTYDVAEIIIETARPAAFDLCHELENTGRFVIIDDYEISAGGVILEDLAVDDILVKGHIQKREFVWVEGMSLNERESYYRHKPAVVFIIGPQNTGKIKIAKELESKLIRDGFKAYYIGISNVICGLNSDILSGRENKYEHVRRLGELARIMYSAGLVFIATASDVDEYDLKVLKDLSSPAQNVIVGIEGDDLNVSRPDLLISQNDPEPVSADKIFSFLKEKGAI